MRTISPTQERLTFRVDMNSLREGQIGTLLQHATNPAMALMFPPIPGDLVDILDEDDIRYESVVNEITDNGWLSLTVVWESKTVIPSLAYRGHAIFEATNNFVKVA